MKYGQSDTPPTQLTSSYADGKSKLQKPGFSTDPSYYRVLEWLEAYLIAPKDTGTLGTLSNVADARLVLPFISGLDVGQARGCNLSSQVTVIHNPRKIFSKPSPYVQTFPQFLSLSDLDPRISQALSLEQ